MGFLKSLMIRIGADASGVDKELKRASKELIKAGKDWERVGSSLTKAVTLPILAVGAASIKMGLDATETEQKFDYAFGSMADSVRAWSDTMAKARGLDAFDLRNTAADMQTLAKGFGFTNDKASEMSKGLAEAAYALAEIYETDSATVADNISSAFKGRANALKDFGVVIDDTTTKAWAYTHGIAKMGEELTSTQKAEAMYGQIMASAADEMKEFERTGSDLATTMRNKVNTALKEFGVALVQTGAFDKAVDLLNRLLDKALDLAVAFSALPDGMQDFIVYAGLAVAAVGPLISTIGTLIGLFGKLGLAAAGAGGSMAGAFAVGAAVVGAGAWTAGQNRAKGGMSYSSTLSDAMKDKNGDSFADRLSKDLDGQKLGGTGGVPGYGLKERYNRIAEEIKTGKDLVQYALDNPIKADPQLEWMTQYNKLLADQAAEIAKQEKAAKAAAALDTFRSSLKSLAQTMMDAAKSFANFTGAFDKVERENISGQRLANRMTGQLQAVKDWAEALKSIKGKVSAEVYAYLRDLGPSAVNEIVALSKDDAALQQYAGAYTAKQDAAQALGYESAKYAYSIGTKIDKMVNTFNITGDVTKIVDAVVAKLRLAGVH